MKVKTKINNQNLKRLHNAMLDCLVKSVDVMRSDLLESETMPFGTGASERATYLDVSKLKSGKVRLCHGMPYDRRNYFHPEFNFRTDKNTNAQGLWLETYIHGVKKMFVPMAYAKFLKGFLKDNISRD